MALTTTDMPTKLIARELEMCHFFRLSGELRNCIYAYVFYEPAGLRCETDENGVARLYSRTDEQAEKVQNYSDHAITKASNSPSTGSLAHYNDANQLKYVNRQLRQETRGLGIIHNELHFYTIPEFSTFIRTYSSHKVKYLTKLHIHRTTSSDTNSPDFYELIEFFLQHPSAYLCLRDIGADPGDERCIFVVVCMQMLFREHNDLMEAFFTNVRLKTTTRARLRELADSIWAESLSLPPNFRMYPKQESFDEVAFRNKCRASDRLQYLLRVEGDGSLERWVALMKDVYEHGV